MSIFKIMSLDRRLPVLPLKQIPNDFSMSKNVQKSLLEKHRKCKKNLTFNEMRLALDVVMWHPTQWGQIFSKIAFEFLNRNRFSKFQPSIEANLEDNSWNHFFPKNKPHCVPLFFILSRKLSYFAWSKIDFHFMPGE